MKILKRKFMPIFLKNNRIYFSIEEYGKDTQRFLQVCVNHDENSEIECKYAKMIEENLPQFWEEEVKLIDILEGEKIPLSSQGVKYITMKRYDLSIIGFIAQKTIDQRLPIVLDKKEVEAFKDIIIWNYKKFLKTKNSKYSKAIEEYMRSSIHNFDVIITCYGQLQLRINDNPVADISDIIYLMLIK